MLSIQGAWDQFLVRELSSHTLRSTAKRKNKIISITGNSARWTHEWFFHTSKNFFYFLNLFLIFWLCHMICGILVRPPGIEPTHPALEAWRLNHWTAREIRGAPFITGKWNCFFFFLKQNWAWFSSCDACEPRLGEASFSPYHHWTLSALIWGRDVVITVEKSQCRQCADLAWGGAPWGSAAGTAHSRSTPAVPRNPQRTEMVYLMGHEVASGQNTLPGIFDPC